MSCDKLIFLRKEENTLERSLLNHYHLKNKVNYAMLERTFMTSATEREFICIKLQNLT